MGHVLFHLAFPVNDLKEAQRFYVDGLGCRLGRVSSTAITLDLKGNQLIGHLVKTDRVSPKSIYPSHFGLVFTSVEDWQAMADRAQERALPFYQKPRHRYPGTRLEHSTFFLEDPFHNLLEFKHYTYVSAIFGEQHLSQVGDAEAEE
jgi:extradiol dioxygenase family protein